MSGISLSSRDLRVLEGLSFQPRKSFVGVVRGERLTAKRGLSIEFSDYREYSEGDDLRHLDWNVLARLGTPIMKTFRDEEDLAVYVLFDTSPSMEFGEPTKLEAAKNWAIALGLIGLGSGDAVSTVALGSREPRQTLRGRTSTRKLHFLVGNAEQSARPLVEGIRGFLATNPRKGLVFLVSDGLDPNLPLAIRQCGARGHEFYFLQILSTLDQNPDLEGDLRLVDGENGDPVEITANSAAIRDYKRALAAHVDSLREAALAVGGFHALINSDDSIESVIGSVLRRQGWVK